MSSRICFSLVIGLAVAITLSLAQDNIRVSIEQGTVLGIVSRTERGSQFYSFLGIPYAMPPIDELRFKDPIRHPGWTGELQAKEYGPLCTQPDMDTEMIVGNEDCLTINVHTPQFPAVYPLEPLPVMVYIYGGYFFLGSSAIFGAAKLLTQPVLLVTFNYRLGVLGFLSTDDETLPGNYGMMDSVLALQWVRDNIGSFGGDPQKVTIFGVSSGGAMVSHLLLSPLARGLFWTAIAQSGAALCEWATIEHPMENARMIATMLNCDVTNGDSIMACIRHKSLEDILKAETQALKASTQFMLSPVVDQGRRNPPFLPDTPQRLLQSGNFTRIPLISGVTQNEGLFFVCRILRNYAEAITVDTTYIYRVLVPVIVGDYMGYSPEKIDYLKHFYFHNVDVGNLTEVIPPLTDLFGDVLVNACIDKLVKFHSEYAPTYMYVFSHHGLTTHSENIIEELGKDGIQSPFFQTAVTHGDDMHYLFNFPNSKPNIVHEDQRVQEILILLWTTFARTASPNMLPRSPTEQSTFWNGLRTTDMNFFNISFYPHNDKNFRKFQLSVLDLIENMAPHSRTPEKYTNPREPYFTVTWVLMAVAVVLLIVCIALTALLIIRARKGGYSTDSLVR